LRTSAAFGNLSLIAPINPAYNSLSGFERKAGRAAGHAQPNPITDSDGCQRVVETSERTYLKQLEQKHQR
jgi:hypothetical protein